MPPAGLNVDDLLLYTESVDVLPLHRELAAYHDTVAQAQVPAVVDYTGRDELPPGQAGVVLSTGDSMSVDVHNLVVEVAVQGLDMREVVLGAAVAGTAAVQAGVVRNAVQGETVHAGHDGEHTAVCSGELHLAWGRI